MGMHAGLATSSLNSSALANFELAQYLPTKFALEAGWTVMYATTDPLGNQVAAATSVEGFTIVFFRLPGETARYGRMCVAESYNFSAGTVTNPAMMGSWTGNAVTGGVFSGPVLLSTLAGATYATPAGCVAHSAQVNGSGWNGFYIGPGVFSASGWDRNASSTYLGNQRMVAPATPVVAGGPDFAFYFTGANSDNTLGRGWRLPKHPHAGVSVAFDWAASVAPWHYFANTALDAYSVDAGAYPSSRASLYRSAAADGHGVREAELRQVRWGNGAAAGATHVDSDGVRWYYAGGGAASSGSLSGGTSAVAPQFPFTAWARL